MATCVYINDESGIREEWIATERVQAYISAGWSFTRDGLDAHIPTFEEADINYSGVLSSDEVRAAAQQAGIDGWDTKRIKTLKVELGYVDKD